MAASRKAYETNNTSSFWIFEISGKSAYGALCNKRCKGSFWNDIFRYICVLRYCVMKKGAVFFTF